MNKNEEVEKTHKSNTLRFRVECGVILLWVWLSFHSCEISPVLSPQITQQIVSEPNVRQSRMFVTVTGSYECSLIPVLKVFLTKVLDKCVPFKYVNGDTSEDRLWLRYSNLKMFPFEGECTNVERTLTWGRDL